MATTASQVTFGPSRSDWAGGLLGRTILPRGTSSWRGGMEGNDATTTRDPLTRLGTRRTSRKRFLAEAAGLTGALMSAGLLRPEQASAATVRALQAGRFLLDLPLGNAGALGSVAGGNITSDVLDEPATASFVPKHLGLPKFEEFVVKA